MTYFNNDFKVTLHTVKKRSGKKKMGGKGEGEKKKKLSLSD